MITVIRVCRKCGAKIFSDAPEGLCTRCVLETALRTLPEETVVATPRDDPGLANSGQRLFGPLLHDLGTCEVKHGVKVALFNLYSGEVGNPDVPTKLTPDSAR
jgi:ribosomal protein L40E